MGRLFDNSITTYISNNKLEISASGVDRYQLAINYNENLDEYKTVISQLTEKINKCEKELYDKINDNILLLDENLLLKAENFELELKNYNITTYQQQAETEVEILSIEKKLSESLNKDLKVDIESLNRENELLRKLNTLHSNNNTELLKELDKMSQKIINY